MTVAGSKEVTANIAVGSGCFVPGVICFPTTLHVFKSVLYKSISLK